MYNYNNIVLGYPTRLEVRMGLFSSIFGNYSEKQIKKILLITNFNIYDKATAAFKVAEYLDSIGCEICLLSFNRDKICRFAKPKVWFTFLSPDEAYGAGGSQCSHSHNDP